MGVAMITPGGGWPKKINNGPFANTQILREGGRSHILLVGTARVGTVCSSFGSFSFWAESHLYQADPPAEMVPS